MEESDEAKPGTLDDIRVEERTEESLTLIFELSDIELIIPIKLGISYLELIEMFDDAATEINNRYKDK